MTRLGCAFWASLLLVASACSTAPHAPSRIYILDHSRSRLLTFTADGKPSTPTITTGLAVPVAMTIDAGGKLYVVNGDSDGLRSYRSDGTPVALNVAKGFSYLSGVAVAADGTLYVSNRQGRDNGDSNGGDGSILTFAPNGKTGEIVDGVHSPNGVAIDGSGKIYVINDDDTLTTYGPDGKRTPLTITSGLSEPTGVAVDTHGKIYVTNYAGGENSVGSLTSYTPDGVQTSPTISEGLHFPEAVTVDATGKIYVVNAGGGLTTYTSDGKPTTPTIPNDEVLQGVVVR